MFSRVWKRVIILFSISVCHYLFSVTHASAFEASAIGKALPGSIATSALVMNMYYGQICSTQIMVILEEAFLGPGFVL